MSRVCVCGCGRSLEGRTAKTTHFDRECRKRTFKARRSVVAVPLVDESTVARVRGELADAGRAETYLGAAALALAERIDNATAVMGFAALVRELRVTMEAAMEGAQNDVDALTDIRSSAALKLIRPA
jgi:hypothetical protein